MNLVTRFISISIISAHHPPVSHLSHPPVPTLTQGLQNQPSLRPGAAKQPSRGVPNRSVSFRDFKPFSLWGATPPSLWGATPASLWGATPASLRGAKPPSLRGAKPPSLRGAKPPFLRGAKQLPQWRSTTLPQGR